MATILQMARLFWISNVYPEEQEMNVCRNCLMGFLENQRLLLQRSASHRPGHDSIGQGTAGGITKGRSGAETMP